MAYTNAIFYLDYALGSDSTRATITNVIASNPSGTTTLMTKVAHGLATGAVITTSGYTTWLNGEWKITVVDLDTFTLDTAVWQATADADGSVVPFGGSSWADAWKTLSTGASAARVAPGDIVRIAKSPAPTSCAINATWTANSQTVTLASSVIANVETCEALWTAGTTDVTIANVSTSGFTKGGNSVRATIATAFAGGTVMYKAITDTNYSSKQQISFWIRTSVAITDNKFEIRLYANNDATGSYNNFLIPPIPLVDKMVALTIDFGGALLSSVKSVALHALADPAAMVIHLDNIIACNAPSADNSLSLTSLISKSSTEQGSTEAWYVIQSISSDGLTVKLDGCPATPAVGSSWVIYPGTTQTTTLYKRETIKTTMVSSGAVQEIQDSGTLGLGNIQFQGGYDTSTTEQTGETFFDGQNGAGNGVFISAKSFLTINYLNFYKYGYGFLLSGQVRELTIPNIRASYCTSSNISLEVQAGAGGYYFTNILDCSFVGVGTSAYNINFNICRRVIIDNIQNLNCSSSTAMGASTGSEDIVIKKVENWRNNDRGQVGGLCQGVGLVIHKIVSYRGGTQVTNFIPFSSGAFLLRNTPTITFDNMSTAITLQEGMVMVENFNNTAGDSRMYGWRGSVIAVADANRHTLSGFAWKISITNTLAISLDPLRQVIARVACTAGGLVTVKAWMKKTHITDIAASLVCRASQLNGLTTDSVATKGSADTNYEELTITFTPTEAGVVEIEAVVWWVANAADESVYVDDISITQA